jgi:hypothetical protein
VRVCVRVCVCDRTHKTTHSHRVTWRVLLTLVNTGHSVVAPVGLEEGMTEAPGAVVREDSFTEQLRRVAWQEASQPGYVVVCVHTGEREYPGIPSVYFDPPEGVS